MWHLTEQNVFQDLERENGFWFEAIRNLRKGRDRVARRYNALRRAPPFKEGELVYWVNILNLKWIGISPKFMWSKPMVVAKFLKPSVLLANAETGLVVRKLPVSQINTYHKEGSCQAEGLHGGGRNFSKILGP